MNLKRFSLLCSAAFALTATAVFAQDTKPGTPPPAQGGKPGKGNKPGQGERGQRRGNNMSPKALSKALDLTPEQEKKLEPAFKKFSDLRKKLAEDTTADPKTKRSDIAAATKELMKSVEEVLTPEQKTKFDELKKKMEEAAKNRKKKNNN